MAFNISESLLERVRTAATRAKSQAYDDEIKTYIRACLYDLDRLNILFAIILHAMSFVTKTISSFEYNFSAKEQHPTIFVSGVISIGWMKADQTDKKLKFSVASVI